MANAEETSAEQLLLNSGSEEACRKELDSISRKLDNTMKSIQKALDEMESKFSASIADMDRDLNKLESDISKMMDSPKVDRLDRMKLDKLSPVMTGSDSTVKN
ncbi:hypothetical protein FBUS_01802 [Fasciolopsis buskii]|uniref:Uncharacterized protein n=1 Tax=Fasciolopsis buskii TaxID=27845 RepID=A0A8E0RQ78_9TREM|nr:hypothetical protein FBUS_01802 [Fasciolopsis buski]